MVLNVAALMKDLEGDDDLTAGAATCCRHLRDAGYDLTSVYLERGGVLRCYGSLGYWQVLDGFPLSAGVLGATVRSGEPRLVRVANSTEYLAAAGGVVTEVCAPILVDGVAVGAVNVESRLVLTESAVDDTVAAAASLAERVAALGGAPRPSGWRLVADTAPQVQRLRDPSRIAQKVLDVALELSGNRSGMVVLDEFSGPQVEHAAGPLRHALLALSPRSLDQIGAWVQGPRSCYTVGEVGGQGFTGQDRLRSAGVQSLSVFALVAGGERLGFLLVADERPEPPQVDVVEQTELLTSIAACALGNVYFVEQLLDQSRRDPLTGLGHSGAFSERLRSLQRSPHVTHAIVSIDVDHFKEVNDTHGHAAGDRVLRSLASAMDAMMRVDDSLFRTGGDEFAAVVAVDSEADALSVGERLRDAARSVGVSVSIGVALAGQHEYDEESVFARADAAMYGVKNSGRGGVALASRPSLLDSAVNDL